MKSGTISVLRKYEKIVLLTIDLGILLWITINYVDYILIGSILGSPILFVIFYIFFRSQPGFWLRVYRTYIVKIFRGLMVVLSIYFGFLSEKPILEKPILAISGVRPTPPEEFVQLGYIITMAILFILVVVFILFDSISLIFEKNLYRISYRPLIIQRISIWFLIIFWIIVILAIIYSNVATM